MAKNLDAMINKIGFEIVSKGIVSETEINKMLGVLANDGVYAWWVYIKSKLNWKFTKDKRKFEEFQLIKFLFILAELNELFAKYGEIISDKKIEEICTLQNEIELLTKEIGQLTKEVKKERNIDNRQKENELNQKKEEKNKKENERNNKLDNFFHQLSENLPDLLFFREILEKILIYARYHAKAMGEGNE